jgi:dolichol-phosphate mannosyltransferase
MEVSIVIPTFNEAPNVTELIRRIEAAVSGHRAEIVFVDDSSDETPDVIEQLARRSTLPIRLLRRPQPVGGLSGAVLEGLRMASSDWCVVMDGDLQHPPEVIPVLLRAGLEQSADLVVASRHVNGGSSAGLSGGARHLVSLSATILTRAMFPNRLRNCTDPMTGFFAVKRSAVNLDALRPRGFKILLEILARNTLAVVEEPFVFAERQAGESKAGLRQGLRFLTQIAVLRFGRLSGFAVIGGIGALANLAIMATLQAFGVWYVIAAVIAAIITITSNFVLQERFVFRDLRGEGRGFGRRFAESVAFNGSETALRTLLLWLVVRSTSIPSILTQAALLGVGFVLRFVYHSRIVYRPMPTTSPSFDLDSVPDYLTETAGDIQAVDGDLVETIDDPRGDG